MFKPAIVRLLLTALCLPGILPALEAILPFEGKFGLVQGFNPRRSGAENLRSFGGEAELNIFPVFGSKGSPWRLTPAYTLEYSGVNNVLQVDEGLFLFTQQLSQTAVLGGAWRPDEHRRVNASIFYESFVGKLAADEAWFKGLYDYQDVGAESSWRTVWGGSRGFSSTLGLRLTDRVYPNFVTLAVPEVREKDSVIVKPFLGIDWEINRDLRLTVDWSLQAVGYKQAIVVDDTGTTAAGVKRRDTVSVLAIGLPWRRGDQDWYFGLENEARSSNYGYFDSANFVHTPNYNDYQEFRLNASWAYSFEGPWWVLKAPQLSVDGRVSTRLYAGRLARDENGIPLSTKQQDQSYWLAVGLNSPLTEHWSLSSSVEGSTYRSNDLDESTTLNNYTFNTFRLGAQFAY